MPIDSTTRCNRSVLVKPTRLRLIAALIASCITLPADALSLMESYKAALENDPKFQGALYDKEAGAENEAIGRAGLLPSVGASYNFSKNDADRTITFANGTRQNDSPNYDSKVATLSVRQPLFNMEAWQRYKGGKTQANYSGAKFITDAQDLISRLTTAYLGVLLAEDQLLLAAAQRDAYNENQLSNQQLFEKGAGTRTDVLETRARYELAKAQVLETQDNVASRRNEFAAIIGRDPGVLDSLLGSLPELPLMPATLAEWEQLARERNPEIRTQRFAVEYAQTEVERLRAGHYPRVDLVASQSRNTADSLFTYNQQSTVNSIGIQMSIPIYSGGSVNAQTRQAAARLAGSRADLDTTTQKTLVEIRKQFPLLVSARIRIAAMEQAESSAVASVEATRKSVTGGQRVNLDVLNALQQLYTTRRDLSEARHGYLLTYARLHAAAGMLDEQSLGMIASSFKAGQ
jgi:protease secretion system outer membrane protein